MTIEEFREHVAGRQLEPGRCPIIDWCGVSWRVIGEPYEEWARGQFVVVRPLNCLHGGRDKLMPVRVAHGMLPEGLDVADVV